MEAGEFVGVISDTHGLLRPEAVAALEGAALILHAGDAGKPEVLAALEAIAPVHAVRGNVDRGAWAQALPESRVIEWAGQLVYMLHDLQALEIDPLAAGIQVVVSGHSHQPKIDWRDGVLYLNPGSAGPRRFSLPICLARLRFPGGSPQAELVTLNSSH